MGVSVSDYMEWEGVISLDVPLWVSTTTGRPKHVDPEEQKALLAFAVEGSLRMMYENCADVMIGSVMPADARAEKWREWDPTEAATEPRKDLRTRPAFGAVLAGLFEDIEATTEALDRAGLYEAPRLADELTEGQRNAIIKASESLDEATRTLKDAFPL